MKVKLLCLMILCLNFPNILFSQHEVPVRTTNVPFNGSTMVIDGLDNEAPWSSSESIDEMFNTAGVTSVADFSGSIKLCYNYQNLYLFADITDDIEESYAGTGDVYMFDCIEVMLDLDTLSPTPETGSYSGDEIQLRYNRSWDLNTGNSPRNGADVNTFAYINNASGWQLEAAIPWVSFMPVGSIPEDFGSWIEKALGFDVMISDNDGSGRDGQLAWDADDLAAGTTEDNAWKDTRVFGVIKLLLGGEVPFANAGADQTVFEDSLVVLTGSKSYDNQSDALTYLWKSEQNIHLSDSTSVSPTFTAPQLDFDTDYIFSLTVKDGTHTSMPDRVTIHVWDHNRPPVANAGNDFTVEELSMVNLDGSLSYDPEDSTLTYHWLSPESIELSDPYAAITSFIAPKVTQDTTLLFQLIVFDGIKTSSANNIIVTVINGNELPVANAGTNKVASPNSIVVLDGTLSYDPEGGSLAYNWTSIDEGELAGSTTWMPIFVAPDIQTDKIFRFALVVNDGIHDSKADTVSVVVDYNPEGLSQPQNEKFILSPNPANDYITVIMTSSKINPLILSLIGMDGKELYKTNINEPSLQIDLTKLNLTGMVFVKVEDELSGAIYIEKLIIK